MKLFPVALAIFYRQKASHLEIWVQVRTDDGPFHGFLEFPGGGIEPGEEPIVAAVREVHEEVGIHINVGDGRFMGVYPVHHNAKTVLLNVFLFPEVDSLGGKGEWLSIKAPDLSSSYQGKIPPPNHQIIDDLYRYLYDGSL
jgi:mutator protein MutT